MKPNLHPLPAQIRNWLEAAQRGDQPHSIPDLLPPDIPIATEYLDLTQEEADRIALTLGPQRALLLEEALHSYCTHPSRASEFLRGSLRYLVHLFRRGAYIWPYGPKDR